MVNNNSLLLKNNYITVFSIKVVKSAGFNENLGIISEFSYI